jgi:hypothetical protein
MLTVVAPKSSRLCVTAEIEGCEFDIAYRQLFRGRMQSRLASGLLIAEASSKLYCTYRTATRSFLSMCRSLGLSVGA